MMNSKQINIINKSTISIALVLALTIFALSGAMILSFNNFLNILNGGFSWIFVLFVINMIIYLVFNGLYYKKAFLKDFWFYLNSISLLLMSITYLASLLTLANSYDAIKSSPLNSNVKISLSLWFFLINSSYLLIITVWFLLDKFNVIKNFNETIFELHAKYTAKPIFKLNEKWTVIDSKQIKKYQNESLMVINENELNDIEKDYVLIIFKDEILRDIIENGNNVVLLKTFIDKPIKHVLIGYINKNNICQVIGEFILNENFSLSKTELTTEYNNLSNIDLDSLNENDKLYLIDIADVILYLTPNNLNKYNIIDIPTSYLCLTKE